MKVHELIAKLQKFDQDMLVVELMDTGNAVEAAEPKEFEVVVTDGGRMVYRDVWPETQGRVVAVLGVNGLGPY